MGDGNDSAQGTKGRTQATETEIIIYETGQQQEHKIKNDKKRKKITKPNHAAD
jgi:hypothetical protein